MQRKLIGMILSLSMVLIVSPGYARDTKAEAGPAAVNRPATATTLGITGEIQVDDHTNVGFRSLAPGRYRVQHIKTEHGHAVRFSPVGGHELLHRPVIVECTVEPLEEPARVTLLRLRLGRYRMELVKLYIEGESVAHVF